MKKLTRRSAIVFLVFFVIMASVQPAYAQPIAEVDIETAIGEGVQWLVEAQNIEGSVFWSRMLYQFGTFYVEVDGEFIQYASYIGMLLLQTEAGGWGFALEPLYLCVDADAEGKPVYVPVHVEVEDEQVQAPVPHSSAMETSMAIIGLSVAIQYEISYMDSLAPLIIRIIGGANWLVANQYPDGHWVWEYVFGILEWQGLPNVVSTYMGMLGLTIASEFAEPGEYEDAIENALYWILRAQNRDGGWGLVPEEYVAPMLLGPLEALKAQVEALPDGAFEKPEKAENQRRKLCHELDKLIRMVERGKNEQAMRVLEDFKGQIERWIVDPGELLLKIETIGMIAILAVSDPLTTSGPAWGLCLTLSESSRTARRQIAAITRAAKYLLSEQKEHGSWSTIAGEPQEPYTVTRAVDFLITYKMLMQMTAHGQPRRLMERVEDSIYLGIEWIQDNNLKALYIDGTINSTKPTRDVVDALVVFEDAKQAGIDVEDDWWKADEAVNWLLDTQLLDTQEEGGWGPAPAYPYDTVFDTAFAVPALVWSVILPLEPPDPLERLEELRTKVEGLLDEEFKPKYEKYAWWLGRSLRREIDRVIDLVEEGKYEWAMYKLEYIKAKMKRWLVDPSHLINEVDIIISVLEQLT